MAWHGSEMWPGFIHPWTGLDWTDGQVCVEEGKQLERPNSVLALATVWVREGEGKRMAGGTTQEARDND